VKIVGYLTAARISAGGQQGKEVDQPKRVSWRARPLIGTSKETERTDGRQSKGYRANEQLFEAKGKGDVDGGIR